MGRAKRAPDDRLRAVLLNQSRHLLRDTASRLLRDEDVRACEVVATAALADAASRTRSFAQVENAIREASSSKT